MAKLARRLPVNRRTPRRGSNINIIPATPVNIFNFQDDFFTDTDTNNHNIQHDNNLLQNINTPIDQLNKDLQNNQNWLRVVHLNARSIPGHLAEISRILSATMADIIGVSETFIKNDTPEHKYNIEHYTLYTENRTHTTQGGVGIYVKSNIAVKQLPVPKDIKHPEVICLELTIKQTKIAVLCVYKGLGLSYTSFSHIFDFLADINSKYENTITLGDFNVNQLDKTTSQYKYLFNNIIQPLSLKQIIEKPTRIDGGTKTLIDLILLNNPKNMKQWGVADVPGISDHHMIYMTYAIHKPKFIPKLITKRDFSNFSSENFIKDIQKIQWNSLFTSCREDDLDGKVKIFEDAFTNVINQHAPFKTVRVTKEATPWLSTDIKSIKDYRDKLKTHCNITNNAADIQQFKQVRNQVSHAVKKAQKTHLTKNIDHNIDNTKKFFDQLKKNHIVDNKKQKTVTVNIQLHI